MTRATRFWAKVDTSAGSFGCWPWTASRFERRGDYGQFNDWPNGPRYAHRVAYELARGPIPAGRVVAHSCDNPPCVNPTHLFVATQAENLADMVAKGRQASGARNGRYIHGRKVGYRKRYAAAVAGRVDIALNEAAAIAVRADRHLRQRGAHL